MENISKMIKRIIILCIPLAVDLSVRHAQTVVMLISNTSGIGVGGKEEGKGNIRKGKGEGQNHFPAALAKFSETYSCGGEHRYQSPLAVHRN